MKPATVDEYLNAVPDATFREALVRIRSILTDAMPEGVDTISYGMPCRKQGKARIHYAAFKNHCSLFPGYLPEELMPRLKAFKISKGTIQFDPLNPIPEELIRELARQRLEL